MVAELIEVQDKPAQPWGDLGQAAFGAPPEQRGGGTVRQGILAVGRQDIDPDGLTATVHSLLEQVYPADRYEILLVDNRSTDGTHDAAQALSAEHPTRVRALAETQVQSSYAARNLGVKSSRGEVLCFIDADMVAPTHYLATVAQHFADPGCQYLGCAVSIESAAHTLAAHFDRVTGFPVAAYLSGLHFVPTREKGSPEQVWHDAG
jgi:glycosyltransferase involved in cell wall biosynthesis